MNVVGDLERLFAALYPIRWLLGLIVATGVAAVLTVAARRDWFAPVRRHPRQAVVIVVVALIVFAPIGFDLASPLWTRVELTEASPLEAPSASGMVVARGQFAGADEFHFGKGTAKVVETAANEFVLRFEDFSVRNGPDLYVYLSPSTSGYAEGALELGLLKATDGAFNYALPAGVNPAEYGSVVVWCKQFAVLFATAPLAVA